MVKPSSAFEILDNEETGITTLTTPLIQNDIQEHHHLEQTGRIS